MKKPIALITILATATTYGVPLMSGNGSGAAPTPTYPVGKQPMTQAGAGAAAAGATSQQKVDTLAKTGLYSNAQARMIGKMQADAAARAAETNSAMELPSGAPAGSARMPARNVAAPNDSGMAVGGGAGANGSPAPGPTEQTASWRLEGVIGGGVTKAAAVFEMANVGEVIVHAGERLNHSVVVKSIKGNVVELVNADHRSANLTPW